MPSPAEKEIVVPILPEQQNPFCIMGVKICGVILGMFFSVFLTGQIFLLSNQDIVLTGLFITAYLTSFVITYPIVAHLCKKFPPIYMIRMSAIFAFAFLAVIVFMPDIVINHAILLGGLWGITRGFYWCVIEYAVATKFNGSNTLKFDLLYRKLKLLTAIIFPITFGLIINFGDFVYTAILVLVVCGVKVALSFGIKLKRPEEKGLRVRQFFRTLKSNGKMKPAIQLWLISALKGPSVVLSFAIVMLIIMAYGTHLDLGILHSVIAIVAIMVTFVYKRVPLNVQLILYFVIVSLMFIASIPLLFTVGVISVFIFKLFFSSSAIIKAEHGSAYLNFAKTLNTEQYTIESHLFLTVGIWFGRFIMCMLMILAGLFGGYVWFVGVVLTMIVSYALSAVFLWIWKQKYIFKDTKGIIPSEDCECESECECI